MSRISRRRKKKIENVHMNPQLQQLFDKAYKGLASLRADAVVNEKSYKEVQEPVFFLLTHQDPQLRGLGIALKEDKPIQMLKDKIRRQLFFYCGSVRESRFILRRCQIQSLWSLEKVFISFAEYFVSSSPETVKSTLWLSNLCFTHNRQPALFSITEESVQKEFCKTKNLEFLGTAVSAFSRALNEKDFCQKHEEILVELFFNKKRGE